MVVEAFLIVSVTTFYLAIMPRCFGSEDMVPNVATSTELVECVDPICFRSISEISCGQYRLFCAIILMVIESFLPDFVCKLDFSRTQSLFLFFFLLSSLTSIVTLRHH